MKEIEINDIPQIGIIFDYKNESYQVVGTASYIQNGIINCEICCDNLLLKNDGLIIQIQEWYKLIESDLITIN